MIVMSSISVDATASEVALQELEGLDTPLALHHCESRLHLPSSRHSRVPLHGAAETTFTVDEADDPLLDSWPFLLIVRTGRIVTAHVFPA